MLGRKDYHLLGIANGTKDILLYLFASRCKKVYIVPWFRPTGKLGPEADARVQGIVEGWLELFLRSYCNANILALLRLDNKVVGCNAMPCLSVFLSGAAQRDADLTIQSPSYVRALVTLLGNVLVMIRRDYQSRLRSITPPLSAFRAHVRSGKKKRVTVNCRTVPKAFFDDMAEATYADD